jgi:hypothetical protein
MLQNAQKAPQQCCLYNQNPISLFYGLPALSVPERTNCGLPEHNEKNFAAERS